MNARSLCLTACTELREIRAGSQVIVPERTLLLVFKLKAVWDRSHRLQSDTSEDEEWEKGKLLKDKADILALLDRKAGGTEVDINYLGQKLETFPFLRDIFQTIPEDREAVAMYGKMNPAQTRDVIDQLFSLIG